MADPSGTRKVVYLCRTTSTLLRNYRAYHGGMLARLAQAKSAGKKKTGAQTVASLVETGRRLSAMDFVAFLLLFHDIQQFRVRPVALLTESSSKEALTVHKALQGAVLQLREDVQLLGRLRRWLTLTALLSTELRDDDMRNLWIALRYTPEGRAYPDFVRNAHALLWKQEFEGCQLQFHTEEDQVDATVSRALSPRCQCATMWTPPGSAEMRIRSQFERGRGGEQRGAGSGGGAAGSERGQKVTLEGRGRGMGRQCRSGSGPIGDRRESVRPRRLPQDAGDIGSHGPLGVGPGVGGAVAPQEGGFVADTRYCVGDLAPLHHLAARRAGAPRVAGHPGTL